MEQAGTRRYAARAVVLEARPLGGEDAHGNPLFVVDVTVLSDGVEPWRARLSVGAAAHTIRQLHPGSELAAVVTTTAGRSVVTLQLFPTGVLATPDQHRSTSS